MTTPSLDTDVLIIGAGMSGLCFAIQLAKKYPEASFSIVEKSVSLGGTWWVNTYPGCGCDVPSHFYSYSFALKPDWSQAYALQPEIVAYFRDVAEEHDVLQHISFGSTVLKAEFGEATGTWRTMILDRKTGRTQEMRSRVLIAAVGALSVPKGCDIKGAERYKGRLFHSAQWDHSFDWSNKEVVVIGSVPRYRTLRRG
jgi:cation diffusion facilitator CzcD-associated flavoprotein CzcO